MLGASQRRLIIYLMEHPMQDASSDSERAPYRQHSLDHHVGDNNILTTSILAVPQLPIPVLERL